MSSESSVKYACDLCGYQTLNKAHMKLHKQTLHDVHNGERMQCQKNNDQASTKNIIDSHQQSLHLSQKFQ